VRREWEPEELIAAWTLLDGDLDFLKESDFVTDFTDAFTTLATRKATPREVIRKREAAVLSCCTPPGF
jgi:hypothetical protein